MPLEIEELEHVLDEVRQAICIANREGTLEGLLDKMGLRYLLKGDDGYRTDDTKLGSIIVLGESSVDLGHLQGVSKSCGVSKERIEFYDYAQAQRNDISIWQYSTRIAAIMCGPLPHKGTGMGDESSMIVALENQEGFPPTVRMGASHGPKLTKTSFRLALQDLIDKGIVLPDVQADNA